MLAPGDVVVSDNPFLGTHLHNARRLLPHRKRVSTLAGTDTGMVVAVLPAQGHPFEEILVVAHGGLGWTNERWLRAIGP